MGEFVWNMATYELREAVNRSAQEVPPEVDEFELAGVTKAPSRIVKPCRVAESPIHFECRYHTTLRLPGNGLMGTVDIIIGRVVAVHIKDEVLRADGKIDELKIRPIARMGYYDYTSVESSFETVIPGNNKRVLEGLEGTPHFLSHTCETREVMPATLVTNIERVLAGEPPLYTQNPKAVPKWRERLAKLAAN